MRRLIATLVVTVVVVPPAISADIVRIIRI